MGLLDSVIGALSGINTGGGRGDLLNSVLALLADDGAGPGMTQLMQRFEAVGVADVMNSWIGRGANLPISPDMLRDVLGPDSIQRISDEVGLSPRVTMDRLSQMLPYVVDKLTPAGEVPDTGLGDFGELMGRIGGVR